MIALARDQEAREPLGIDYIVADACSIVPQEDYDVVVSAWLLVYAQDRAPLTRMCRGLADRVSEGAPIDITVNLADYSLQVRNYYLPIEAYAAAFRPAGFHDFVVHIPDLKPATEAAGEGEYWDYLLDNPFLVVMDCVKA